MMMIMITRMTIMTMIMITTTEFRTAVRSGALVLCPGSEDVRIMVPDLRISLGESSGAGATGGGETKIPFRRQSHMVY